MLGLYDLDEAYYDDLKVKSSLRVSRVETCITITHSRA